MFQIFIYFQIICFLGTLFSPESLMQQVSSKVQFFRRHFQQRKKVSIPQQVLSKVRNPASLASSVARFNSSIGIIKSMTLTLLLGGSGSFNSSIGIIKSVAVIPVRAGQRSFNSSIGIIKRHSAFGNFSMFTVSIPQQVLSKAFPSVLI